MKIIITGATGFVGAHLVRYFSRQGHQVVAMGRQVVPPKELLKFAKWTRLDLHEENYPDLKADVLIHAAAMATDRGNYQSFHESNIVPTQKLYKQFKGNHFVFISSASVYPFTREKLKETDATIKDAPSNYGRSKIEAENELIRNVSEKAKLTILRPRSIYGTHDRVLLPRILQLYRNKIILLGSMDINISMTHISNLITALKQSIDKQQKQYAVYNVADQQVYVLKDIVVKLLSSIADRDLKTRKIPLSIIRHLTKVANRLNMPFKLTPQSLDYLSKSCVLNTNKIENDLEIKLDANFYDQLDEMVHWINKVGLSKVKSADPLLPWLD